MTLPSLTVLRYEIRITSKDKTQHICVNLKGNRSDGLETLEWLKQISEGLAEKLAGFVVDKVFKGKQLERPIKFTIRAKESED